MKLWKSLISIFIFHIYSFAIAEDLNCPWEKLSGNDLLHFSYTDTDNKDLNFVQIKQDLNCLKILFKNYYVGQEHYTGKGLIKRLDQLASQNLNMKSSELVDKIFGLHQDMLDIHLSYQVAGITKRFLPSNPQQVTLSETLEAEKIYDRPKYVYFMPGERLYPNLTEAETNFINLIKTNDKNLVIDLRNSRGGANTLAEELAVNLFTADQHIPSSKKKQALSGIIQIGICKTAYIVYGDQVKDYCDQIKKQYGNLEFSDLVKFNFQESNDMWVGKRKSPYQSKIYLLIDSDCASSCETIIEKLSRHPNALMIGANTGGALHFSNAISYTLPNSGIWVKIPSLLHIPENDAPEGIGYSPQIKTNYINLEKLDY